MSLPCVTITVLAVFIMIHGACYKWMARGKSIIDYCDKVESCVTELLLRAYSYCSV